jgi:hypothetical protein
MAEQQIDTEVLLIIPFSIGAAASLGLVGTDILPFVNLGDTLLTTGSIDWTIGRGTALVSLIAVLVNRDASVFDTGGIDLWVAYATIGLVLAPPFLPALESTLAEQPAAIIAFVVQSIGFTLVSWSN